MMDKPILVDANASEGLLVSRSSLTYKEYLIPFISRSSLSTYQQSLHFANKASNAKKPQRYLHVLLHLQWILHGPLPIQVALQQ